MMNIKQNRDEVTSSPYLWLADCPWRLWLESGGILLVSIGKFFRPQHMKEFTHTKTKLGPQTQNHNKHIKLITHTLCLVSRLPTSASHQQQGLCTCTVDRRAGTISRQINSFIQESVYQIGRITQTVPSKHHMDSSPQFTVKSCERNNYLSSTQIT